MRKIKMLGFISTFLLAVAHSGVTPACWFYWYQPKLPE